MTFIEITGQSCSGKSSFVAKKVMISKELDIYKQSNLAKLFIFFYGIYYLGLKRTKVLFSWSLKEDASLFFRINVFRNAVSKFGIFQDLNTSPSGSFLKIVDEGLSHLPFLFLNTDTELVVGFISNELRKVNVRFLK